MAELLETERSYVKVFGFNSFFQFYFVIWGSYDFNFSHLILSPSGPRAYPEELLGADEGGRGGPSHRPQGQGEDGDVVKDDDVDEDGDVVEDEDD